MLSSVGLSNERTSSTYNRKQRNNKERTGEDCDTDGAKVKEDILKTGVVSRSGAVPNSGEQSSKSLPKKKKKTGKILDFVTLNSKAPKRGKNATFKNKVEFAGDKKTKAVAKQEINDQIDCRNVRCPVPGCGNRKGKGFRRSGITEHLTGQHPADLQKTSVNNQLICDFLKSLNRKICASCMKITNRFTELGLCNKCDEKRPAASKVIMDLTTFQRKESTARLMIIQGTKFTLRNAVPRKL